MDPPASNETLAQGLNGEFPVKLLVIEEGDECEEGSFRDLDDPFDVEANWDHEKIATKQRKKKRRRKQSRKDLQLAKRTSNILSNYRDFLLEHEMNSPIHDPSDLPDDGFRGSHCHEHKTKNPALSNPGGEEAPRLLRDFSRQDDSGFQTEAAMPDVSLGLIDDGPAEKEYETTILHSKRVKYGIILSFGVPIVIVVVIMACARYSNNVTMPARENASGWHSEVGYLLDREDEGMVGKLRHHNIIVTRKKALQKNGVRDNSSEKEIELKADPTWTKRKRQIPSPVKAKDEPEAKQITTEPEEEAGEDATANYASKDTVAKSGEVAGANAVANFDLEKLLHRKFKPLWLGSREGWNGGSHDEATQFCESIRGKELCPYAAMCPYGPGKNVMAGRHPVDFSSQGEQFAPIYGHANRWIMVGRKNGDASTTCMSHEQLEGRPPSWGLSGDRPELKSHIMCCSVPKFTLM